MKLTGKTSLIIPAYNEENELPGLIESLKKQTIKPFEAILIDDNSIDKTSEIASAFFKVISLSKQRGPAAARNFGIKIARGEFLAFIDADCRPESDWIEQIEKGFEDRSINIITGGVYVIPSTVLGKAIASLGFPGGGSLGFEKMWKVAPDKRVGKISTGNFAVRRKIFEKYGGFDETFSYYCEDAWFSYCLINTGEKIIYRSEINVLHLPMEKFGSFIKWHYKRGVGSYLFKQKVGNVKDFIHLRIWSSMNIIKTYYKDIKFPLIFLLLFLSFVIQQYGFWTQKWRQHN
jgi:glycosyltransferase involved in cell wall biosynthesis